MDDVAIEVSKLKDEIKGLSNRLEASLAEGDNPISLKCAAVLETPVKCYDFSQTRRHASCRAWDLMEAEHISWGDALTRAWEEVRKDCTWG